MERGRRRAKRSRCAPAAVPSANDDAKHIIKSVFNHITTARRVGGAKDLIRKDKSSLYAYTGREGGIQVGKQRTCDVITLYR